MTLRFEPDPVSVVKRIAAASRRALSATVAAGAERAHVAITANASGEFGPEIASSFRVEHQGDDRHAVVSDHPAAGILDHGGTVNASSRLMPVPLTPEAKGRPPSSFGSRLVAIKTASNVLLAEKASKDRLVAHYVLKKQVRLDATGYMSRGVALARDEIADIFGREFAAAMEASRG